MSEESKGSQIWKSVVNNLIIVVLVAAATAFIDYRKTNSIEAIHRENKKYLDSVQTENRRLLDESTKLNQFKYDTAIRNLYNRQQLNFAQLQNALDKQLQQEKFREELKVELTKLDSQYKKDLGLLAQKVENQRTEKISDIQLDFVGRQLSEFYWPILSRLEKRNALADQIEKTFVQERTDTLLQLENHLEIVEILENKMHLAIPDEKFIKEANRYIEFVSIFEAYKKMRIKDKPENLELVFPLGFYKLIKARTELFQEYYSQSYLNRDSPTTSELKAISERITRSGSVINLQKVQRGEVTLDEYVTIKKSWTKTSFSQRVDDRMQIVFLNHDLRNKDAFFDIQFIDGDSIINNKYWIKTGDILWLDYNKRHYQIYFEDIFETKANFIGSVFRRRRINARLRVKRW